MRSLLGFGMLLPPVLSISVLSISLAGCVEGGAGITDFIRPEGSVLGLEIGLQPDSGAPGADFDRVAIRLVSSKGDTLRDTLDENGRSLTRPEPLNDGATPSLPFRPRYDVQPLSAWTIEIEALAAGAVVRAGTAATGRIDRGDTLRVAVALAPRS